jgi:UDPglucose 6-dehydrogenase
MGTVKDDFFNPEMMIIGSDNEEDMDELKMFYDPMMPKETRWEMGTIEEAECIKVFYNTFISAKLGLVNMIQDVAHKVGNINSENVAMALANSTYRIMSPMYMKPGMGDGGPCHPRDNIALRKLAQDLDLGYDLFAEIMKARDMQAKNMADFLSQFDMPVVIMNRNFKRETQLEDGSPFTLVGSFIDDVQYEHVSAVPSVYLYGFGVTEEDWAPCSIIVDVTRQYVTKRDDIRVIHYGDTSCVN